MADTTTRPEHLSDIYRSGGSWSQVYLDVSVDTSDPPQVRAERMKSIEDTLQRAGAPASDVDAVREAMAPDRGIPSPACQFMLVREGSVVVDEWMPGLAVEPESTYYGPLPDLAPLLKSRPELSYLVVETARDGGEVRLFRAGSPIVQTEEHVQGRTDTLHKPQAGGWSHDRFQDHAEELWRQTQSELAATVDEIVRTRRPRLLVIAGDIRARQLLADELSQESRDILSIEPTNTRADGSDDAALVEHIDSELTSILAQDKAAVIDRLNLHDGRGDNLVEFGLGPVVQALAAAQVDTLVLDSDRLRDRTALALDVEPWVATTPEETLGATVLGEVPAQLALLRAALLTDARVLFTDSLTVPDSDDATRQPQHCCAGERARRFPGSRRCRSGTSRPTPHSRVQEVDDEEGRHGSGRRRAVRSWRRRGAHRRHRGRAGRTGRPGRRRRLRAATSGAATGPAAPDPGDRGCAHRCVRPA